MKEIDEQQVDKEQKRHQCPRDSMMTTDKRLLDSDKIYLKHSKHTEKKDTEAASQAAEEKDKHEQLNAVFNHVEERYTDRSSWQKMGAVGSLVQSHCQRKVS